MTNDGEWDEKLMSCPFCGEAARLLLMPGTKSVYAVGCGSVNLCPGYVWKCAPVYLTAEQAATYWNRRYHKD